MLWSHFGCNEYNIATMTQTVILLFHLKTLSIIHITFYIELYTREVKMLPCPSPIHTGIAQMQNPTDGRNGIGVMHTLPPQQVPITHGLPEHPTETRRGGKLQKRTNTHRNTQSALTTISFTPCSLATGCSG